MKIKTLSNIDRLILIGILSFMLLYGINSMSNNCQNVINLKNKGVYFDNIHDKEKFDKRYNECLNINDIKYNS